MLFSGNLVHGFLFDPMSILKKYFGDLFLPGRFYLGSMLCILLFMLSFFIHGLYVLAEINLFTFLALALADYIFLFFAVRPPRVKRILSDRLSNGDENPVTIYVSNRMNYPLNIEIIDELPEQFQLRDFKLKRYLNIYSKKRRIYDI